MCTTCTTATLERSSKSTEAFTQKLIDSINGSAVVLMTSIGHRVRLFDTMNELGAATSEKIANEAGLNERYVREWLGAMVTGGIVEHDPSACTYYLPPEHAAVLTRAASPNNIAVSTQWISLLGGVEDQVVEAFYHGKGVPYSAYRNFTRVMAEESSQTVVAGLEPHILPLVPGLTERLTRGIDVLDIACGAGLAMIALAEKYPRSRFWGYDFSEEAIASARAESARRGVRNVRFAVKDLATITDRASFDLVTAFDAIHDQARPDQVLKNILTALRPGGVYLMQDIKASSHVHKNHDLTFGPFTYTVSCMHCMSVSLANGGPGLGAAWGKEKALEMLKDAGFRNVRVHELPHDPLNYYYITPIG
jgi:2-polyprenyl-3-methyl-5-hydroxy-6-metoxy-1,4-benzoquinol methylase